MVVRSRLPGSAGDEGMDRRARARQVVTRSLAQIVSTGSGRRGQRLRRSCVPLAFKLVENQQIGRRSPWTDETSSAVFCSRAGCVEFRGVAFPAGVSGLLRLYLVRYATARAGVRRPVRTSVR